MNHTIFILFDAEKTSSSGDSLINKFNSISFNFNINLVYLKKNRKINNDEVLEFSKTKKGELLYKNSNFLSKQIFTDLLNSFHRPNTKYYLINCLHGSGFGYGDYRIGSDYEPQLYAHYFENTFFNFEFVVQNICYSSSIEDLHCWSLKTNNIITSPYLTSFQFVDLSNWIQIINLQKHNMFDEIFNSYVSKAKKDYQTSFALTSSSSICKLDLSKLDFEIIISLINEASSNLKDGNKSWILNYYNERSYVETRGSHEFYSLSDFLIAIPIKSMNDQSSTILRQQIEYFQAIPDWSTAEPNEEISKISVNIYLPVKEYRGDITPYYSLFWESKKNPSKLSKSINEFYNALPLI